MTMTPQEEWKKNVEDYAGAINAFVENGLKYGFENAGPEPEHPDCEHLVTHAIEAVREANGNGTVSTLRELWPPAHQPLIPVLEDSGQSIPNLCLLDDGTIIARIGTEYQDGHVVQIQGDQVETIPDLQFFGQSPDGRYFATSCLEGVLVTDGWMGEHVCLCSWPTGIEDLPDGADVVPFDGIPAPSQLIPFPNGQRVLLVSSDGIFVLSRGGARRLIPTDEAVTEWIKYLKEEEPDDEITLPDVSMAHGAVSRDGKWIAVGCQDSKHLIYNEDLELVAKVGHLSEYPHYALFNTDSSMVAFNSCHFYNGVTIGVPTNLLPGLSTESYEEDERFPVLEGGARVYAGTCRKGDFIIGDAGGYVRAVSETGEVLWQHFIGSSIGDIVISRDGKTLVVSTYAGFIAIIDLDAGDAPAYRIGSGNQVERRRWIFWKNEDKPLMW